MPPSMSGSAENFAKEAEELPGFGPHTSKTTRNRPFRATFGSTPEVCSLLWNLLVCNAPVGSQMKHLFWAFLSLKVYASEYINRAITGAHEKTSRKWVWIFIHLISDLKIIHWSSRLVGREDSRYKSSVDGVDFMINEPTPFDPCCFSHKFKSSALRYEVGVAIQTVNICWGCGPFPCGDFSDVNIYKMAIKNRLLDGEKFVADDLYRDSAASYGTVEYAEGHSSFLRAGHEVVKKRLKQFGMLNKCFRHRLHRRSDCIYSVANITLLLIREGEPVFE